MSSPAGKSIRPERRPFLLGLYSALLDAGGPLLNRYLARRVLAGREDPARLGERCGAPSAPRPAGALIWFHAASVGESMSILPLLDRLLAERPDLSILVTTGTVTSAQMVAGRLSDRVFHQYIPVDRRAWVERFLAHWRPDCAVWVESEIWPNLLDGIARRAIPAALINARMSERSHRRWGNAPRVIARLLSTFDLCLAQTEAEAARLKALGAREVFCVGHLKFAADPLPADAAMLASLRQAIGDRPLWVLASSHPGEDEIAIAAHRRLASRFPDLLTVIVPRHVKRGPAIAALANDAGLTVSLRSDGRPPARDDAVYIVDSMGELGLWYRLTGIALIGGSLVPIGGHNPIEAAQLDCALLFGPHMFALPEIVAELQADKAALTVDSADVLADAVGRLLQNPAEAMRMASAARAVAARNSHVLDRTLTALAPLFGRAGTAGPQ